VFWFQWLRRVDSTSVVGNGTVRVDDERYVVLPGGGGLSTRHDGTYMSRLVINNATERHTGYYACSATNTHGFNYTGAYLRVMPPRESTRMFPLLITRGWRRGVVVSGVRRMNEVNARRARLGLGWVTVFGRVYHLRM